MPTQDMQNLSDEFEEDSQNDEASNDEADEEQVEEKEIEATNEASNDEADEEGYFADDDEEKDQDNDKKEEVAQVPTDDLGKYILNNLNKISVRIIGADDSVQTVQVYGYGDLPKDYKGFATPYEAGVFTQAVTAQELEARRLRDGYQQNRSQAEAQEFTRRENEAIREDIADLQREGEIPKFKANPGSSKFEEDEAAKIVDATITFMNKKNSEYLEKANKGRAYKRIGFEEAFNLMKLTKPDDKQKKQDAARKELARKTGTKSPSGANTKSKIAVSGKTMRDLEREFIEGEDD